MLRFFLISCALDLVLLAFGAGFWDPCRVMAPSQNQGDQHAILSIDESCKTGTVEWHYPQFDEGGLKVGIMYVRCFHCTKLRKIKNDFSAIIDCNDSTLAAVQYVHHNESSVTSWANGDCKESASAMIKRYVKRKALKIPIKLSVVKGPCELPVQCWSKCSTSNWMKLWHYVINSLRVNQ